MNEACPDRFAVMISLLYLGDIKDLSLLKKKLLINQILPYAVEVPFWREAQVNTTEAFK